MMFLGSCLEGFAQFLDLVVIANQFAEGAALMLDLVPLALGILVMLFALLECSLEALFDLFAINFRSRLAKAGFLRSVPVTMLSRILNDSVARLAKVRGGSV